MVNFEKYFGASSSHIRVPIGVAECGDEVYKGLQSGFSFSHPLNPRPPNVESSLENILTSCQCPIVPLTLSLLFSYTHHADNSDSGWL